MGDTINVIVGSIAWAVIGGWRRFIFGYLGIIIGFGLLGLILTHTVRPIEEEFKSAQKQSPVIAWSCFAGITIAVASMVLAVGMKINLMASPPTKPLWEAKLRMLDRFKQQIQNLGERLVNHDHSTSLIPDPLQGFIEDIRWHFQRLSVEVAVSRDIVCRGVEDAPIDEDCHNVLRRMNELQANGLSLIKMIPKKGKITERIAVTIEHLNGTVAAVQSVADECTKIMKKKGML